MKRIALASPPDRPAKDPQKSRVGNGSVLLPGVDGRSAWARRAKDVLSEHLSDVPDASAAERSIIRRAKKTVELEGWKLVALAGRLTRISTRARVGQLKALLEAVGLRRRARA
jgi:hypothetical protein